LGRDNSSVDLNNEIDVAVMATDVNAVPNGLALFETSFRLSDVFGTFRVGTEPIAPFMKEIDCSLELQPGTYAVVLSMPTNLGNATVYVACTVEALGSVGTLRRTRTVKNGVPELPNPTATAWNMIDADTPSNGYLLQTAVSPTVRAYMALKLDFSSTPYGPITTTTTTTVSSQQQASRVLEGAVGYDTFFVGSPRTDLEAERG
jgi:hypothetical protein